MLIWKVIKRSFKQFYQHLFLLVLINIFWFIMVSLSLFIGYSGYIVNWFLPILVPLILLGPLFLSGLDIAYRVDTDREIKFKQIFNGIRKYFKRGLLGFLFLAITYLILLVDFYFFFIRGEDSLLMLIVSVFFLYLTIFFTMFQLFFWGLLIIQKQEKFKKIIKRSFLLVLHNPGFSLIWVVVILVISVLLLITGVGLPVVFMSVIALLIVNGSKLILKQYDDKE